MVKKKIVMQEYEHQHIPLGEPFKQVKIILGISPVNENYL